jgi:CCR4-NOT transcription complex subunit 2
MSEAERFSLPGLLAKISPDSLDYSPLAVGQDLTQLGLDLGRPENEALYSTFGTPFSSQNNTVRPIIPDFTLPAAYTVTNVPNLSSKIASLNDDTLFAIFYGEAGTWNQEVAAQEL